VNEGGDPLGKMKGIVARRRFPVSNAHADADTQCRVGLPSNVEVQQQHAQLILDASLGFRPCPAVFVVFGEGGGGPKMIADSPDFRVVGPSMDVERPRVSWVDHSTA
jgi:hypothetical protein